MKARPRSDTKSRFTRHFYKPQPLRTLAEIRAELLTVEKQAEGLQDEILRSATLMKDAQKPDHVSLGTLIRDCGRTLRHTRFPTRVRVETMGHPRAYALYLSRLLHR